MKGADKYAEVFATGQFGRLYLVSSEHARGRTFRIFVLPDGEDAVQNGKSNPPLNTDAVEVYGVVRGNPGWTEEYGWLHEGKWQDDFQQLVERKSSQSRCDARTADAREQMQQDNEAERVRKLLSTYWHLTLEVTGTRPTGPSVRVDRTVRSRHH